MWPIKLPVQAATPKTIAIVGKYHAAGIAQSLSDIAAFLEAHGHTIVFEAETAQNIELEGYDAMSPEQIGQFADAAIVVGGDGTMLGIARQLAPFNVPLIGINQGRLGFMTDISLDRMIPVLADMLDGKVDVETRSLLEATVYREGEQIFNALAFNDVVVARGASSGMVELEDLAKGVAVRDPVETERADQQMHVQRVQAFAERIGYGHLWALLLFWIRW